MEITRDYQGFTKSIDNSGNRVTETYKGFKKQCEDFIETLQIGQDGEYGSLSNIEFQQDEGPYWTVTLEWSTEKDDSGNQSSAGSWGRKSSSLTVRMLALPIEKASGYRTCWNYHLAAIGTKTIPSWWSKQKNLTMTDETKQTYEWVASKADADNLRIPKGKEGKKWNIIAGKTKEGVETVSFPIYELTETSKHISKSHAGWAIAKQAGKIADPEYGDFGIKNKLGRRLVV